jgi:cytochrome c oxidase subunit 2
VIHDFSIPAFRIKCDVLPGPNRYTTLSFTPSKVGKFHLFCGEYCGTEHSRMVGWITVMEPAAFQDWLSVNSDNSAATRGRKLFLELQCITCHNRESNARAPLLEKLFMRPVTLEDGKTVMADESYLRESILRPEAKIVAGFRPIMPSFEGQVSEMEMLDLITFIKGLDVGQTPDRNEATLPPAAKTPGESAKTLVPRDDRHEDGSQGTKR